MKRILLVFLLSFVLFIIPKDTFALTANMKPNYVEYFTANNDKYELNQFSLETKNNYDYYGFRADNTINRIQYTMPTPSNWNGETNDYSFILWQPNLSVASLNGNGGAKPIVYLNGVVCDVDSTWSATSSSAVWSQAFGVKCSRVKIQQGEFGVNILTPPLKSDVGLANNFYGISKTWAYSPYDEMKPLLEELKKQTDAINNQTEEVKKGTEATKENKDAIDKNTEATNKQTETIKDSDTSDASNSANSFFNGFDSDDFGLSDIVTMPLEFIKGLSSNTCNSLSLPMPFINKTAELPCMTSIYQKYFGAFLTLYQAISTGLISYWVCINIFALVQGFKNPENDQVEVLDL